MKPHFSFFLSLWLFCLPLKSHSQNSFQGSLKAGHYHLGLNEQKNSEITFFSYDHYLKIRPQKKFRNTYVISRFLASLKFPFQKKEEKDVELRQLSLEVNQDYFAFRFGLQEIVWGDTLISPVTDIWQHLDSSKNFFLESDYIRKPAPSLFTLVSLDSANIEIMLIPVPVPPDVILLSKDNSQSSMLKRKRRKFEDAEIGARLGVLLGSLDAKLFVANHENRRPIFVPVNATEFGEKQKRVTSFGSNLSLAIYDAIARLDAVYQMGETFLPRKELLSQEKPNKFAVVSGLDVPLGTGNFVLQHQLDLWLRETTVLRKDNWLFVQLRYPIGILEPEFFGMKGFENEDLWLRARIKLNVTDTFSLIAEAHEIEGDGRGFHPSFNNSRIYNAHLAFSF
jgi:hypothetical protein